MGYLAIFGLLYGHIIYITNLSTLYRHCNVSIQCVKTTHRNIKTFIWKDHIKSGKKKA